MKIVILALGRRGDIQPLAALGQGLRDGGYSVTFASGTEYEALALEHGLAYHPINTDPKCMKQSALGRAVIEGTAISTMRIAGHEVMSLMRNVLDASWEASRDADSLIYNPAALGGYHIAEKLQVPAFIASPLPAVTPTGAFPNPSTGTRNLGSFLNKLTYSLSRTETPYLRTINRWRGEVLELKPRGRLADTLSINGRTLPVLYCYSPSVVPYPKTWPPATFVTGYWFSRRNPAWQPPADLVTFLASGPKPVYVGFGGTTLDKPEKVLATVVEALGRSGQRGVVSIGFGEGEKPQVPDTVLLAGEVPHRWLFPQVDAVVHHGGAGTTGAGLAAGKPSIICPFDGDQFFWAKVVENLGVGPRGIPLSKMSKDALGNAILTATTDEKMRKRAASLGDAIRSEDGIHRAIKIINSELISWRFPALSAR